MLRAAAEVPSAVDDAGASEPLTARERELLRLMAGGYGNREIADALGIVEPTMKKTTSPPCSRSSGCGTGRAPCSSAEERFV